MISSRMLLSSKLSSASFLALAACFIAIPTSAYCEPGGQATAENMMASAFDAITEVPFASTMLGIVRNGESVPTTPENIVARLDKIEAMLQNFAGRLAIVEAKVAQLQAEVVKISNVNRMRELQRVRGEILEICQELKRIRPGMPKRRF